ncbi:MAG: c-type cytochrome domain-containing protein [Planctomycetota bacterium]
MINPTFRVLALVSLIAAAAQADQASSDFLTKHCIRCHGSENQKADRRFDDLPVRLESLDDLERYQEVVDQLNLRSMPPRDQTQPTAKDRATVIAQLTARIAKARAALGTTHGHSVLRRLNSWEYRQTIGDLLGLNVNTWNPAEDFPAEVKVPRVDIQPQEVADGLSIFPRIEPTKNAVPVCGT